jgi:hypothetical protein
MIQTVSDELSLYSISPLEKALDLRKNSNQEDCAWGKALGARALFLAQAIVSIVAIPFFLLAALFVPLLVLCSDGSKEALKTAFGLGKMMPFHLSIIPTSLFAAFLPHSLEWISPMKQTLQCLQD